MEHVVLVDPDGAGAEGVADSDGGVEAGGVDGGGEAVGRRVAEADGVGFIFELGDGADGAEDLFLHDLHVFRHAREDGRLDEVALFAVALAADFDFGAFFPAGVDVAGFASVFILVGEWMYMRDLPHDAVILQLGNLRTLERVRTKGVTHNVLLRSGLECFDKLVIDPLLDIYPGSSAAALAVVEENTEVDPRDRIFDIRIVEDNIRALATKLQGNLFQIRASGRFHDLPADNGRSGESDLVNVHVGREGSTSNLAEARDDVDDTGWETGFFDELGGVEGTERGLFGGLENDDVTAGDGRANLPGPHEEWEIPWDDLRANTNLDGLLSTSDSTKLW